MADFQTEKPNKGIWLKLADFMELPCTRILAEIKFLVKNIPPSYYHWQGTFFVKIYQNDHKDLFDVKLFKLAEFFTELAQLWEIIGREHLKDLGNNSMVDGEPP